MGVFILFNYLILMILAYGAALLASFVLFACLDAFANRNQLVSRREKLSRKYRTDAWYLRTLRIFVRVVLVPALLLAAVWWIAPAVITATSHPSFVQVIGAAPPSSVHILNSSETGTLDTVNWIHFNIDPLDMARLIPKGETVSVSTVTAKQMDFQELHPPEWWKPEGGGGTWRKYDKDSVNPSEHLCLLVNAHGNEVYAYRSVAFD